MRVSSKRKNLLKYLYRSLESIWDKFVNTVWSSPIIFQAPLTFFLAQHFDLLGRRLWPDVLEPDNTRYEEITREYLSLLDELAVDPEDEKCKCQKRIKAKTSSLICPIPTSSRNILDKETHHMTRELLEKFPEWDEQTLIFIKNVFQTFSNTIPGYLTRQEFLAMLSGLGDSAPKLAVLSRFSKLSQTSTFGEVIRLSNIYDYIYNCRSSFEKPNTSLKQSRNHLRKKASDLSQLSHFLKNMSPDDTIHYGFC